MATYICYSAVCVKLFLLSRRILGKQDNSFIETYQKKSPTVGTIQYVTKNDCQHGSLRMKLNTDCIALPKEHPLPFVPCEKTRVHPLLKLYRSDKNNLQVQMLLKEPEKLLKSL